MTAPKFRNGDKLPVYPLRTLLRGESHWTMPTGPDGFVVEDEDLIVRWYGPKFRLDAVGRFRLMEWKYGMAGLTEAQSMTFGLIATALESSDRFDGYYLVQYDDLHHGPDTKYWVNGWEMTSGEFREWLLTPTSTIDRLRWPVIGVRPENHP